MRPEETPPDAAGEAEAVLLTEAEAAEYLGIPAATLRQWRYLRQPPAFARLGRHIRYRRGELDAWVDGQTVRPS